MYGTSEFKLAFRARQSNVQGFNDNCAEVLPKQVLESLGVDHHSLQLTWKGFPLSFAILLRRRGEVLRFHLVNGVSMWSSSERRS